MSAVIELTPSVPMPFLASRLGIRYEHLRRWMIYLNRWCHPGPGNHHRATVDDVVAATVALAVVGDNTTDNQHAVQSVIARAVRAGNLAAATPDARWLLAAPTWASGHPSAEDALAAWVAKGRPVVAFVDIEAVLAPVADLIETGVR